MDKQIMVHLYNGIFCKIEKWAITQKETRRKLKCILQWKQPIWNAYILHDFNYVTVCRDSKKMGGCQDGRGEEGRGMNGWEQRGFLARETILSDTAMLDTQYYTMNWQNPYNSTTQTVNPNVNYGLSLIIMCQHWLIYYNKCNMPMRDVNNRRSWRTRRTGSILRATLYFLFNFSVNLKLL